MVENAVDVISNETLKNPGFQQISPQDPKLSAIEFDLLANVVTPVAGYNPFVSVERPAKFVPVLEARGGSDKDPSNGHRRDTLPIANAIAHTHGAKSVVIQVLDEEVEGFRAIETNAAIKRFLETMAHGVIVRINPGTLSTVSQKKCDDMLRGLSNNGIVILTHPDVATNLGAKDALVKIKRLKCGLEDTEVYYDSKTFEKGFRKSIAFQPRVIKQNRGSQGEGIWIVKLKDETAYCSTYGERSASLDTELVLVEAYDNHIEHHTVGEFIEFCINGRTSISGEWESTGAGHYFDGGLEAGSMMVDQRFLPRIVEGEVRCLFVGRELVEIIHKKPASGGLSATLASGAIYTKYKPDDEKFARLVKQMHEDLPRIMECFGMSHCPLPLLWTADYIYGDTDDDLYVGEINCSCVGITKQLHLSHNVAKVVLKDVFGER